MMDTYYVKLTVPPEFSLACDKIDTYQFSERTLILAFLVPFTQDWFPVGYSGILVLERCKGFFGS